MIAKKRSMPLKPGRVSGCIKHRFRREFTDLNTKNRRCYGEIFAAEMAAELGDAVKQWKIEEIIPVPLHRSRQRIRGYNQAQILAEELGKRLDLPVNKDAVKRIQKNATSESAWEQRQDSKSKRSIWCHKILDSEKNVCWSSMIFIQPEIPYTEWQRC